ncbi:hypothetical protein TNIN_47431 [Trichonephila inaurata madagascariensis]|uniref:Uncharacterized protein n=1 Tax=Trichonephila inaurata madagascariensis TaxID=2747483 RepID=A0A8X6XUG4_9ARAC|nr:hypothetical protein TNIN_47431 [Trichonephila inaurata madagascariensis]
MKAWTISCVAIWTHISSEPMSSSGPYRLDHVHFDPYEFSGFAWIIIVRIYCLHLATGRTIHTRSGSGPTIYRGGPDNDRGDQTGRDRTRGKGERYREKRGERKKDGWTMDCNLVPS